MIDFAKEKTHILPSFEGSIVPFRGKSKALGPDRKLARSSSSKAQKERPEVAAKTHENDSDAMEEEKNNILSVENIPQICTQDTIKSIFSQYPGYR